jgi:hypothetical protein
MYDRVARLDANDNRVFSMANMCECDKFKEELNVIERESAVDYIYYSRFLYARMWPVKVCDTKRSNHGNLVYVAFEPGVPFELPPPCTTDEAKQAEWTDKWTDSVNTIVTVVADDTGRTTIQKIVLNQSSSVAAEYQLIEELLVGYYDCFFDGFKFDSFEYKIEEDENGADTHVSEKKVHMTISFISKEGRNIRCELSGSTIFGERVFAQALKKPSHIFEEMIGSECVWKKIALYKDTKDEVTKRRKLMKQLSHPHTYWSTDDDDENEGGH